MPFTGRWHLHDEHCDAVLAVISCTRAVPGHWLRARFCSDGSQSVHVLCKASNHGAVIGSVWRCDGRHGVSADSTAASPEDSVCLDGARHGFSRPDYLFNYHGACADKITASQGWAFGRHDCIQRPNIRHFCHEYVFYVMGDILCILLRWSIPLPNC
mgnify:CR=1 FL=1